MKAHIMRRDSAREMKAGKAAMIAKGGDKKEEVAGEVASTHLVGWQRPRSSRPRRPSRRS